MPQINEQNLRRYSHLELISKQAVEGFITGLHKSPFHGFSVEFSEHRIYNDGESTRNIDWKLFARSDKLFVKRYEEETNLRCRILIDNSSSMFFPIQSKLDFDHLNKLYFSAYASAALIQLFRRQRDAFGLTLFSDSIQLNTPARSTPAHQQIIFKELEKLLLPFEPSQSKSTNVANALHEIAENIHRRSLVIIFSDMFENQQHEDDLFNALQHLKHNKHEVILFHVFDKKLEFDFEFDNRPYRFLDMESGTELKLHPNQIRERYATAMKKKHKQLKLKCNQFEIDYLEADIALGLHQILLPYILKRQKLH
ncbi:MAG: DUF58 domain-containing protein [Bacteroidota bacterium]